MKRVQSVVILLAVGLLAGCKGPTGPTGPQGAEGPTGPQGIQGPTGNANIISGADTVAAADWSSSTIQIEYSSAPNSASFGKPARYVDFPVSDLSGTTFTAGAVLVWMQPDPNFNPDTYVQLPWLYNYVIGTQEYHYDLSLTPGNIRVLFFIVDLSDPSSITDPMTATQVTRIFRWVIIPPAAASIVTSLNLGEGPDATISALQKYGFNVQPGRMH